MGLSLNDLVEIGYLKSWDIQPMVSKKGFKLVLTPGRAILEVIATTQRRQIAQTRSTEGQLGPEQERVKVALMERGISEEKAAAISRTHDPVIVAEQIEYVDHEIERDCGRRIKNPPGFIIAFIEGAKPVPHTFESDRKRAERRALLGQETSAREARLEAEWAESRFRERYDCWCNERADEAIRDRYTTPELSDRLKVIRAEISKDRRLGQALDKLSTEVRKEQLMRVLRREVASELNLLTFQEWAEVNGQGVLFAG